LLLAPLSSSRALRHLPSFPTRRSSDLAPPRCRLPTRAATPAPDFRWPRALRRLRLLPPARPDGSGRWTGPPRRPPRASTRRRVRSEEHTSELQSPYDLVCRLLLEKKKQ